MSEALKIYDITNDEMRNVTQEDIDLGRKAQQCLGLTRELLRKIVQTPLTDRETFDIDAHISELNRMLGPR